MRLPWKSSVPSRRASGLCAVFVLLVSPAALCLLLTCPPAMAAGASATDDVSISPGGDAVWLAGSGHDLTCNEPDGVDLCPPDEEFEEEEPIPHIEWSCNKGTFANNKTISIGTAVRYICPNTAENDVKIKVVAYIDEEPASEDEKNVTIVMPTLEWVEFGGTNKHKLYKANEYPWSPGSEKYASSYDTPIPDKAWVRDWLSDPVCYTKASTGGQVTASINITTSAGVTEASTVDICGNCICGICFHIGPSENMFTRNGISVDADTVTVPAMNLVMKLANAVDERYWQTGWYYRVPAGSDRWIWVGDSANPLYLTWGTPNGTATAKRMDWAVNKCQGDDSITALGNHLSAAVHDDTIFGGDNSANSWMALDRTRKNDCLQASELVDKALRLLGVTECNTQKSYASSDATGNPDYPSDVTDQENNGTSMLMFTADGGRSGVWNFFEGSVRAKDGSTWKYWTVFPNMGPFAGAGTTDNEKDKSARYQILNQLRNNAGVDFFQRYDFNGPNIPLP